MANASKQVFISYVEEDARVAEAVAESLEARGISVWYYQRDSLPGVSYLVQIGRAIASCSAIVLIASRLSLASHQVTKEVVRGHEEAKPFVPVLVDVTHREFQSQPEWREAVGAASSITFVRERPAAVLDRLGEGVQTLLALGPALQGARAAIGPGYAEHGAVREASSVTRGISRASARAPAVMAARHELNQPFGEESCEYEVALLQEDYPEFYFEETPFNLDAIDQTTYLVVGRRGCGKSSLAHYFDFQTEVAGSRSIHINEARQFDQILQVAQNVYYSTSMATPALVSVWELLIWSLIFREYVTDAGVDVGAAARRAEALLLDLQEGEGTTAADRLQAFFTDPLFEDAREGVLAVARAQPVIVAVDTLEKYDLTNDPLMSLTAALVECASNFNIVHAHNGVHIKAFLSAEIFPHIKESAVSNTSKFIRNELYLTWRPKDLMRLVCWRLDSFLTHRELLPDGYDPDIDWRNFDDVHAKRWVPYFGESLKNEFGKQERTFPYVLRHIQMRPRQLVILCNQIARLAFRAKRFPRMGEFVVEAIRSAQRRLADEVLNSYSEIHPNVALIIDALRGLPMRFQGNLLDKVARKTASEWQGNYSPANFKRLVAELGIVGVERSVNEKSGIIEADFEYSLEERLPLGDNSLCVIHPMFNAKLNVDQGQELIVLPFPDRPSFEPR